MIQFIRPMPKELIALRKMIAKHSGKNCKTFTHGCFICESYLALERLESMWSDEEPKDTVTKDLGKMSKKERNYYKSLK